MQNQLQDGTALYNEYIDMSGFIIREMLNTKNPRLRFQAGHFVHRPMRLPVYRERDTVVSHHVDGSDIQTFHLHGYGRTKLEALNRAANKLLRDEIGECNTDVEIRQ